MNQKGDAANTVRHDCRTDSVNGQGRVAYELSARLACPLFIFHGLLDDTGPYTQSLAFLEQARNPAIELRLYKDGDHRLLKYKKAMAEAACGFFGARLS